MDNSDGLYGGGYALHILSRLPNGYSTGVRLASASPDSSRRTHNHIRPLAICIRYDHVRAHRGLFFSNLSRWSFHTALPALRTVLSRIYDLFCWYITTKSRRTGALVLHLPRLRGRSRRQSIHPPLRLEVSTHSRFFGHKMVLTLPPGATLINTPVPTAARIPSAPTFPASAGLAV